MRPQTYDEAHAAAEARGARCSQCILRGRRVGPVMPEINPASRLVVIGEAPGKFEVESGAPFVGPSGEELEAGLRRGGLSRQDCSISNVVLCRPIDPSGRPSKSFESFEAKWRSELGAAWQASSPAVNCRPRLLRDIRDSGAKTILSLGKRALEAVGEIHQIPVGRRAAKGYTGPRLANVLAQAGHPFALPDGRTLLPSIHPAYALRSARHMLEVIRDDIAMAARLALRDGRIAYEDPDFKLRPNLRTVQAWVTRAENRGTPVMVDIETAPVDGVDLRKEPPRYKQLCRIRCVGLGQWDGDLPDIIVVPLLTVDGAQYWPTGAQRNAVRELLRRVLRLPLEFQNGYGFDTGILRRDGLMTGKEEFFDLAIGHKNTRENDCRHDLASISRRFLEIPLWKLDVDHKGDSDDEI